MHLSQLKSGGVVVREGGSARLLTGLAAIYALAAEAVAGGAAHRH
ncbi:GguC protein, partial [Amaricoccus sp. HAR-UPW-R2A-40]